MERPMMMESRRRPQRCASPHFLEIARVEADEAVAQQPGCKAAGLQQHMLRSRSSLLSQLISASGGWLRPKSASFGTCLFRSRRVCKFGLFCPGELRFRVALALQAHCLVWKLVPAVPCRSACLGPVRLEPEAASLRSPSPSRAKPPCRAAFELPRKACSMHARVASSVALPHTARSFSLGSSSRGGGAQGVAA